MTERSKGRNRLSDIWKWKQEEWRRNAAIIKTRGFWSVQVVWFVAGGLFLRLLPARLPQQPLLNYTLELALICVIILPIYFSEVMTWSRWINRQIDKLRKQKP